MKCDKCGSDESRTVVDYETGNEQRLCWDHRKEIVLERARQGTPSKDRHSTPEPPESEVEDGPSDNEITGQSGISDFL